jgi:hypothetical protein
MKRARAAASLAALAAGALAHGALGAPAYGTDWDLSLDARLVDSDALPPFSQGGFGTTRYGSDEDGLRLGRLRLAITQPLGELWSVHLDASMYDDQGSSPVGLTEAYLLFRPYPFAGWRFRLKAGGFYAPVSLENRAAGWDSPYTLSYSAIDSWLGVEVRTIGLEGSLEWLGTRQGHDFDLGVTGAVFGWNEQAGEILASNGFLLTDRQTALFETIGKPAGPAAYEEQPFLELDHRVGVYAGVEASYLDRVVLRVLRYDNRADPTAVDSVSGAIAWNTRFDSAGIRIQGDHGWTAIAQYLSGETTIAPGGEWTSWPFRAGFALLSKRTGRHTLALRYDRFEVDAQGQSDSDGTQSGHAWTAAYAFDLDAHWRFALEWLQVVSSSYNRANDGGAPILTETQLQLAVRYSIGSQR